MVETSLIRGLRGISAAQKCNRYSTHSARCAGALIKFRNARREIIRCSICMFYISYHILIIYSGDSMAQGYE